MRYRCSGCAVTEWRGLFPERTFHIRYAIFHGIALGVCGVSTKVLFTHFGYTTDGWQDGLASLGVCALLILAFYGAAIAVEAGWTARKRCRKCGRRGFRLA